MIISLSTDEAVVNGTRRLCDLFPDEAHMSLEELGGNHFVLKSDTEQPIQRITFLGHAADGDRYGDMNATKFAKFLIKTIQETEKRMPGFIQNLQTIDLLGCQLGFVQYQPSFADAVAKYLHKTGYNFTICALNASEEINIFATIFRDAKTHWEFYGLKTETIAHLHEDAIHEYNDNVALIKEAKTEGYEIIERIQTIENEKLKLEQALELAQQTTETSPTSTTVSADLEQRNHALTLEHLKLLQQKKQLSKKIKSLRNENSIIAEKIASYKTTISEFANPREYISQHTECHFSPLVPTPADVIQKQKKYKIALHREMLELDSSPLITSDRKSSRTSGFDK